LEPVSAGTVSKAQAQNNNGQASPAPFQSGVSQNEHPDSFSVNRLGSDRPRGLGTADRKEEVNHDLATMGSGRNDDGLLPDDFNRSQIGELTHDQNTNTNLNSSGNPCNSRPDYNPGASSRTDDEVKNGQPKIRLAGSGESGNLGGLLDHGDLVITQEMVAPSARLSAPANQASFDAGNATKKRAIDSAQMPQSNATKRDTQDIEFARPSGWGKLWRLVQNGNYYYYELRFINADRVRQKGGKITPAIARKLAARKGKGRHKESRKDAERFRGAAEHLASRLRTLS